jgi:hypothetical protein
MVSRRSDFGQEDINAEKVVDRDQDWEDGVEQPNAEMPDKLAQKPDDIVEATDATSVAQGVVADHTDIQNAQAQSGEQLPSKTKSLLRIGPGLITGVADDDPSGKGTYSVAGAQFGYPGRRDQLSHHFTHWKVIGRFTFIQCVHVIHHLNDRIRRNDWFVEYSGH